MAIDIDVCVTFNTEDLVWKYFQYVHHTDELISTFGTLELKGEEALDFLDWVKKEAENDSSELMDTQVTTPKTVVKKSKVEKSSGKAWTTKEKELLRSKVNDNRSPEKIAYFLPTRSLPAITRRIYGNLKRKWDPVTKMYVNI